MKHILFLLVVFPVVFLYGQTGENAQEGNAFNYELELSKMVSIPNSPEAEAFVKYGNTQVNMYTGIPDISVPIHIFKGREMDLPISLTYDASGIKVEQLATQAGLGWNLNVGGRISRIINGNPDDFQYANSDYMTLWDDALQQQMLSYIAEHQTFPTQQAVIDYLEFLKFVNDGFYDTQPDYFSLNVPGLNDHLVFDVATRQAKALNNPRLKITFSQNIATKSVTGWTVTGEDGTVYHFAQAELTHSESSDVGPDIYGFIKDYNSSWVLTKIESPNKKDIYNFSYTSLGMWAQPQPASLAQMVRNDVNDLNNSANNYGVSTSPTVTTSYKIDQLFLTEIRHNGKTIVSVELKNRDDLDIASAINRINLHRLEDGQVYRYFVFEHSYFGNANAPDMLKKRLKLDALKSYSAAGDLYQEYRFEYINPDGVPSRASLGQDYLGYYNGVNSNTVLYPPMELGNDTYAGGNRKVQFTYAKTGLLKKITYPTGGVTEFEYEAHKTPYNNSDLANEQPQTVVYGALGLIGGTDPATDCGPCCQDQYGGNPKVVHQVFNITEAGNYTIAYTFSGVQGIWASGYLFYRGVPPPNKTLPALPYEQIIGDGCEDLVGLVWQKSDGFQATVNLQPGDYQITLVNKSAGDMASLKVFRDDVILPAGTLGEGEVERAGIRVKSITDYTGTGAIAQSKTYRYRTELNGNTASGKIIFNPQLFYLTQEMVFIDQNDLNAINGGMQAGINIKSVANRVASSSGGDRPHVVYSRVYEMVTSEIPGTPVGYSEYNFNTGSSGIFSDGLPPGANYYLINSEVGKQSRISIYDDQNQQLSKEEFTYGQHSFYLNKGIYIKRLGENALKFPVIQPVAGGYTYQLYNPSIGGNFKAVYPQEVCNNNPDYLCMTTQDYSTLSFWQTTAGGKVGTTVSTTRTDYLSSGDMVTQTSYDYSDAAIDHLLRESVTTSSDTNDTLRVRYWYPKDNNVAGADLLQQKNRLSEAVKTETFVNEQQAMIRQQDYIQVNANALLPATITTQKETSDPEERIAFTFYANGNLREAFRPDGSKSVFIWGYDNALLIARLDGISYADINSATISNLQSFSDNDQDAASEQTLRDALNALRDTHPGISITTFTYDPLAGVTSITDPKGDTSFFHYDPFNRLSDSKDADSNTVSAFIYNYAQQPVQYDPLSVAISYGSDTADHQWFAADISGGSGDYSYAWFEGIGASSTDFEANASGTNTTYQLMVNCGDTQYVKLVITDNVTGEVMETTKVNSNSCNYSPLSVSIGYGGNSDIFQVFNSNVSGGSGSYSYAWYKGVGTSSFTYETTVSGTAALYKLFVACSTYQWVKLVVTDTVTGESVVKTKKSNNSPCSGSDSGGGGNDPQQ